MNKTKTIYSGGFSNGDMLGEFIVILPQELRSVKYYYLNFHEANAFNANNIWQGYDTNNNPSAKLKYNPDKECLEIYNGNNLVDKIGELLCFAIGGAAALAAIGVTAAILATASSPELIMMLLIF